MQKVKGSDNQPAINKGVVKNPPSPLQHTPDIESVVKLLQRNLILKKTADCFHFALLFSYTDTVCMK